MINQSSQISHILHAKDCCLPYNFAWSEACTKPTPIVFTRFTSRKQAAFIFFDYPAVMNESISLNVFYHTPGDCEKGVYQPSLYTIPPIAPPVPICGTPQCALRGGYRHAPHRRNTQAAPRRGHQGISRSEQSPFPDSTLQSGIPRERGAPWFQYSRRNCGIPSIRSPCNAGRSGNQLCS